ncbi:M13 family metallopeptidase [Fuerstiella marisgermanici]|uniref:Neutral endopeptidase n=1 Tax=Fuerstiella marisgermanici TaxID=1891926 RepID=A0A1P8WLW4_9PLAN|nr:M13-type metalloendopeptidase [Fuerstiella marisgermanici]APZ95039.1 Neutral endopeptidase [Fuerstiella marisgermanici]
MRLHSIVLQFVLIGFTAACPAQDLFSGIDPDGFDHKVRPQDDLYQHVNGRWLLQTQIPGDKSNYGSFTALDDAARENIRTIIEDAAKNPTDENSRKVGDFYHSFMDTETIDQRGLKPLEGELKAISELNSKEGLFRHLGYLQTIGVGGPIGFFVSTDAKDSTRYLAAIVQSGTSLPDRDYYLEDDDKYVKARAALQNYIAKLFSLSGVPLADGHAKKIVELETKLAKAQWTRTELRDANKRYNKYDVSDLPNLTPELPWPVFFEAVGVPNLEEVNVLTPSFFEALETIGNETDLGVAKAYLTFHLLDSAAPILPEPFADAHFEFHRKELAGVPEQEPRWKRGVDATSGGGAGDFGVLGEVTGQLYVAKHFKPEAKQAMDELVANLMKAYETSIDDLTWMTDETKKKALEKLHKITPKIGYPEKWRDYSKLEIKPDDLIGNMKRSMQFEHQRMIDKLGKPVDKQVWGMTPQTVNAYYNPSKNEIVFPAAILQPPFFDATADDAVNYGGIGAVIGHEISHGFDDQGSKYDGDGNLKNWWTEEDEKSFKELTGRLVDQYAGYEALPGKTLNGELTLGENIADLSGMAIAYKAYILSLEGKKAPVIDGHTGPQRFFLGWAQIWRRLYREEELVRRLVVDPHSPSAFRGNGPVTNLDAFYEAFDVKPGDKLYKKPEDRIQIW